MWKSLHIKSVLQMHLTEQNVGVKRDLRFITLNGTLVDNDLDHDQIMLYCVSQILIDVIANITGIHSYDCS